MKTPWLVAVLLAAFVPLGARVRAQIPERSWGIVMGTVYDSLLGAPLDHATVSLGHSARSSQTDEHGRFVLDSVPAGLQTLSFWRSDLDSIGLSAFGATVTVEPASSVSVALAVPSYSTFWKAACGSGVRAAQADSGLVFGTVTDAETGQRLAGAQISFSWLAVERPRPRQWVVERPEWNVATDSAGTYYLCGTPVQYLLAARARVGLFTSGLIEVLVDNRGISRRDLTVSREPLTGRADSGAALRGLATLVGTVRGERGGVLPGTYASIEDARQTVATDSVGRFVLHGLPSGTRMLMVRRIGYFMDREPVDLRNRDSTRVDVTLAEATVLDTLRVIATIFDPGLVSIVSAIDERRISGFGYLETLETIRRRGYVRSVFEDFPEMIVTGSTYNFRLAIRRGDFYCTPDIFIDGFLADAEQLSSMSLHDLFAVEYYPRQFPGLSKYLRPMNDCGVILVWTTFAR